MAKQYIADSTSLIGEHAHIGNGTRIWQFCNIMNNATIGDYCNIGQNVFIENNVVIGNHVKIKNNVAIYQGVTCEDDVFLGPNCVFTNVINPRSFIEKKNEIKKTIIKKGATIGANATIVCGHIIGEYAMIGAGTVVTHDVAPHQLIVGNPGRPIGYVCKCGERLVSDANGWSCIHCHKQFQISKSGELQEVL